MKAFDNLLCILGSWRGVSVCSCVCVLMSCSYKTSANMVLSKTEHRYTVVCYTPHTLFTICVTMTLGIVRIVVRLIPWALASYDYLISALLLTLFHVRLSCIWYMTHRGCPGGLTSACLKFRLLYVRNEIYRKFIVLLYLASYQLYEPNVQIY